MFDISGTSYTESSTAILETKDISRKKMDFAHQFLKQQLVPQSLHESLQHFRIISYMVDNCLPELTKHTMSTLFSEKFPKGSNDFDAKAGKELITSCVNSFYTISTLLIGPLKTIELKNMINIEPAFLFPLKLPSGNPFTLRTLHLFAGDATQTINLDPNYLRLNDIQQIIRITEITKPHLNRFHKYMINYIFYNKALHLLSDKEATKKIIKKTTKYKFNLPSIRSLRKEIQNNASRVSKKTSFIYTISTIKPLMTNEEINFSIDHAFILVQSYCPSDNTIRIWPFQSWIFKASLADEITKRQLSETGEGAWNDEQTGLFLDRLEDYYCSNTGCLEPTKALACFGYSGSRKSYPLVISDENRILGVSFRWICKEFDPTQSLDHLQSILTQK